MDTDIKSFVKLKYKIITGDDRSTWDNMYPGDVYYRWIWRVTLDMEDAIKSIPTLHRCLMVAQQYIDRSARYEEVSQEWYALSDNDRDTLCGSFEKADDEKRKVYINWMIEELCYWELNYAE
jgi:hypothetical protein